MPINKSDYPDNWPALSRSIKEREGWKCKFCHIEHKAVIIRDGVHVVKVLTVRGINTADMKQAELKQYPGLIRVILTTAHLDHDTTNNEPANLAALCQRCHLLHDQTQHTASRKYGRKHKGTHQHKIFTI